MQLSRRPYGCDGAVDVVVLTVLAVVGLAAVRGSLRPLQRIEDESARMAGLVEDLLLLARLDEQRPLRRDTVDLVVLAADAAHDARALADGHTVALDVPGEGGVPVVGDEERPRQVLANLVTNALRHTPAGTRVTVRARRADGDGVVEVADDGPGLAPEEASRVFDRFYRADPSRTRESGGGAGLGLAIVAALVRAHGGDVEVETTPGRGRRSASGCRSPAEPGPRSRRRGHAARAGLTCGGRRCGRGRGRTG